MLKYLLVIALIALLFGGGGARLRALLGAGRGLKKDFEQGRDRAKDPVGHARPVEGRVIDDQRR
jgi:hypothetical protein